MLWVRSMSVEGCQREHESTWSKPKASDMPKLTDDLQEDVIEGMPTSGYDVMDTDMDRQGTPAVFATIDVPTIDNRMVAHNEPEKIWVRSGDHQFSVNETSFKAIRFQDLPSPAYQQTGTALRASCTPGYPPLLVNAYKLKRLTCSSTFGMAYVNALIFPEFF